MEQAKDHPYRKGNGLLPDDSLPWTNREAGAEARIKMTVPIRSSSEMPQPSTQTAQNQAEVMSKIMDGAAILLETTAEKKRRLWLQG